MKGQRNTVLFLVRFFVTYFILFGIYSFYLNKTQQKEGVFSCSPITKTVANQTKTLLSVFDYEVETLQHTEEMSMKVILNNTYVSRVIEGCNSISIIILFIAFIVAFRGGIKETIIFGTIGSIIIYGVNIIRISFLTAMIYEYQHYQDVLHNIVFPLIIYGTTFLLWIVWVHKFSNYKK